jgi:uncharacterized membrane protein
MRTVVEVEKTKSKLTELTVSAIFAAIICVFTMFIQIQIIPAEGGLVHLGNVPLFFAAAFFGKKTGALAGGIGMMLSDLLSGWAVYAPLTFLVVSLMGYLIGLIVQRKPNIYNLLIAVVAALAVKVAGYYVGEVVMYRSFFVPLASIPGNIIQVVSGAIISVPVILVTRPLLFRLIRTWEEA